MIPKLYQNLTFISPKNDTKQTHRPPGSKLFKKNVIDIIFFPTFGAQNFN